MRQKLFTKEIDNMLFKQYPMGSDLSKQKVVAKIFNPYGKGCWFIINSDPNDPDYLWAIVDLFEIEAGSVSREDLQTIKVPPFGLNLERDLYFQPINAQELYDRLRQGERFEHGGSIDVIQNDKDESYLTSVNAKPTDAAIKMADGGEVVSKIDEVKKDAQHISKVYKQKTYVFDYELDKNTGKPITKLSERFTFGTDEDLEHFIKNNFLKYFKVIATYNNGIEQRMYAKGGTTKSYTYVPKADIKEIDAVIGGKEQKISGKDVLDGAYVKKSFPKVDKKENYKVQVNQYIPYKSNKGISYYYVSDSKFNTINKNTGKIYRGKEMNNYKFSTENEAQRFADKLNNEGENKSVPKSNKGKLSERAQSILDSSLESFENKSASSRLSAIKMVEDNLAANKKGIDNIGMGLDEDMVAAGEEFLKIVKSKKYEDKPEIELGTFKDARYAKGKVLYIPPTREKGAWKGRQERLAGAKGISGKYTHREKGYIMSKSQAEKLKKYILEGYDANFISGELVKPEDSYKKGGVTFKDKVKSISNSLKGKKVPSKLKKDYGATYSKKESVLAATRIAGAMKAKMESKKKKVKNIDTVQNIDLTDFDKDGDVMVDMA